MAEEKGIQITKGSKPSTVAGSQDGIQITRSGKPISGAVPEVVEVELRCASTRKGFRLVLEGEHAAHGHRYKVVSVFKGESGSWSKTQHLPIPRKLDLDMREIDEIHKAKCPHCGGGKSVLIQCGCGGLSCGGKVRSEGGRRYQECPWCKSVGVIEGHIEKVSGQRPGSLRSLGRRGGTQQSIGATDEVQKLPPGNR